MPHLNKWLVALLACLGYGGWALYSNWMGGTEAEVKVAWRAAIIQGSYAGLLTALSMLALEWAYAWFERRRSNLLINSKAQAVAAVTTLQYSVIVPVHWFNQTPSIVMTLAPGFVIGLLFSSVYLARHSLRANN